MTRGGGGSARRCPRLTGRVACGLGELLGEAASQRERGARGALLGQREALREQEGQGPALAHGAQRLHERLLALGGADWRTERVRWPAAEPREGLLRAGGERERVVAPDRHCEEEVVVVTRSLVCTRASLESALADSMESGACRLMAVSRTSAMPRKICLYYLGAHASRTRSSPAGWHGL